MRNVFRNGLAVLLVMAATIAPVWGQKSGGGGTPRPTPNPSPTPTPTPNPTPTLPTRPSPTPTYPTTRDSLQNERVFSGRVLFETGAAPPESVVVQQVCGGRVLAKTYTDSKGFFVLDTSKRAQAGQFYEASDDFAGRSQPQIISSCTIRAVLTGYRSSEARLDSSNSFVETNVGTIVLRSMSGVSMSGSISVTSLQVPSNARKEYDKALSDISNNNFQKAQQRLQRATEIYPKYAAAWVTLGRLSEREKDSAKAREAYSQAIAADSHYLPPYIHLAFLAASESKWDEVLSLTTKAIAADPANFYEPFFLNAAANSNLKHPEEAMKAGLRAAELDKEHHEPRIHLLLARLYASRGDRDGTEAQLKLFIKYAPESPDSTMAKASLKRLEDEKAQK